MQRIQLLNTYIFEIDPVFMFTINAIIGQHIRLIIFFLSDQVVCQRKIDINKVIFESDWTEFDQRKD